MAPRRRMGGKLRIRKPIGTLKVGDTYQEKHGGQFHDVVSKTPRVVYGIEVEKEKVYPRSTPVYPVPG